MLRLALTVLVLGALGPWTSILQADEKSHREAAEAMLNAANMEVSMNKMVEQSLDLQIKANPQLAPVREVMHKFMAKHLSYAALKEELIGLHVEEFTEEELLEIAAFYRTKAGQKAIEKMPVLFQKGAELGSRRVQENSAELRKAIQDELKKRQAK